ncbi:hypothetical protein G9A89_000689 [Geosiphon pyriformis]|nr:hypothetical protein G9A89_000689 [Geosiphon pyriformis]
MGIVVTIDYEHFNQLGSGRGYDGIVMELDGIVNKTLCMSGSYWPHTQTPIGLILGSPHLGWLMAVGPEIVSPVHKNTTSRATGYIKDPSVQALIYLAEGCGSLLLVPALPWSLMPLWARPPFIPYKWSTPGYKVHRGRIPMRDRSLVHKEDIVPTPSDIPSLTNIHGKGCTRLYIRDFEHRRIT